MHITGDLECARDVVQDTFLRLCRQPDEIRNRAVPWLFRVCRNRALDLRRKESRVSSVPEVSQTEPSSSDPDPFQRMERKEALSEISNALLALPRNQQEVIRLKFQSGLSYREISEVTKLSVSNVGFLMHTGLKGIRRRLEKRSKSNLEVRRVR